MEHTNGQHPGSPTRALVLHDGQVPAGEYVDVLVEAGLGQIELLVAATAEPSIFRAVDAVIILCAALTPEVDDLFAMIRSEDPDAAIVVILAVQRLSIEQLERSHRLGATAIVLLGPPDRRFHRQINSIIRKVGRKR